MEDEDRHAAGEDSGLQTLRDVLLLDEAMLDSCRQMRVTSGDDSRLYLLRRLQLLSRRAHKLRGRRPVGPPRAGAVPAPPGSTHSLLHTVPHVPGGADEWRGYCDWRSKILPSKFAMRIKQAEEQAYKDAAAEAMHKAMLAELAEKEQFAETEDDIRRKSYVGLKLHKAFPSSTVGSGAAPTPVVAVRFCPDNDNLFAVATADKVCIYSADPPRLLQTAKAHADGGISDIDWAPAPGQEGLVGGSVGTAGGSGAASARDQAPAAAASNAQAASAPSAGSAASVAPGVSAALPSYSARLMTTGFDASVVVWLFSLHDRGGTPTASLQRRSELGCRVPVTHGRICKWNTSLAVIATCKAGFKFGNRIVKGELRLYNTERRFLCDSASHNTLISAITFDDTGRVVFVATMSGNVHAYVLSGDDSGRIGGVWLTKHQVLLASSGSSLFSGKSRRRASSAAAAAAAAAASTASTAAAAQPLAVAGAGRVGIGSSTGWNGATASAAKASGASSPAPRRNGSAGAAGGDNSMAGGGGGGSSTVAPGPLRELLRRAQAQSLAAGPDDIVVTSLAFSTLLVDDVADPPLAGGAAAPSATASSRSSGANSTNRKKNAGVSLCPPGKRVARRWLVMTDSSLALRIIPVRISLRGGGNVVSVVAPDDPNSFTRGGVQRFDRAPSIRIRTASGEIVQGEDEALLGTNTMGSKDRAPSTGGARAGAGSVSDGSTSGMGTATGGVPAAPPAAAPAAGRALQAVRNLVVASCPLTNCVVAGAESRTVLVYDPSAGKNGAGQGGPGWQDDVGKMLDMLSAEGEKGPPRADAASQKRSTRIIRCGFGRGRVRSCTSRASMLVLSGDRSRPLLCRLVAAAGCLVICVAVVCMSGRVPPNLPPLIVLPSFNCRAYYPGLVCDRGACFPRGLFAQRTCRAPRACGGAMLEPARAVSRQRRRSRRHSHLERSAECIAGASSRGSHGDGRATHSGARGTARRPRLARLARFLFFWS